MRDQKRAESNLRAVVQLDTLGVFVFDVDIVTYEDPAADLYTAKPMKEWPKSHRAGQEPRQYS